MLVYRIMLAQYAGLESSGRRNRWNSEGKKIIYAASSRALACLENVVHRSRQGLQSDFRTLVIEIPPKAGITVIQRDKLPEGWKQNTLNVCNFIGDQWYDAGKTLLLKVPSVIIPEEFNYLINQNHTDFKKVTIKSVEEFSFDPRIKTV